MPFVDLAARHSALRSEYHGVLREFMGRGQFVLGQEVERFERSFARASGGSFCVGVDNGTNAIRLALQATGLPPEGKVFLPSLTAYPTAVAVVEAGGKPKFVDVNWETLLMDRACIEAINGTPHALLPVHLYGNPADSATLAGFCKRAGIVLVEDCAQATGAMSGSIPVGTAGAAGAFSFYPTKNLGAMGDGGAIITNSSPVRRKLLSMREYGKASGYHFTLTGINSRLDELQAGFLTAQLSCFRDWNRQRKEKASIYMEGIDNPELHLRWNKGAVFHQFVIRVSHRRALRKKLAAAGIATLVHYEVPCHLQPPMKPRDMPRLPNSEAAARTVLSLPVAPEISNDKIHYVVRVLNRLNPAFSRKDLPRELP